MNPLLPPLPPFDSFTRSRTLLFLSYRDSSTSRQNFNPTYSAYSTPILPSEESRSLIPHSPNDDYELGFGGGQGKSVYEKYGPEEEESMPKWVKVGDSVGVVLEDVKGKIERLDKMHMKHLLPGFKDRSKEEREIELLSNEITKDFRHSQTLIRRIAEISTSLLNTPSTKSTTTARTDLLMAANVQTALATKVQDLSTGFRRKQTDYLRRLKQQQSGTSSPSLYSTSFPGSEPPPPSYLQSDPFLSLRQDEQLLLQPTSRTSEITSLATSITELSDLFKDLSVLVIDQGTLLDRIDWNLEIMREEVEAGADELGQGATYQKRSGKCSLIFLLLILVFGAVLVIVFRPSSGGSGGREIDVGDQGGFEVDNGAEWSGEEGDGELLEVGLSGERWGRW